MTASSNVIIMQDQTTAAASPTASPTATAAILNTNTNSDIKQQSSSSFASTSGTASFSSADSSMSSPPSTYFPNDFVLGLIPKEQHLERLAGMLRSSLDRLVTTREVDEDAIARMTSLICNSMNTRGRVYHSMQHVFDISKEMHDPEIVISALFHDVIYYSIDKQFLPEQQQAMEGCLEHDTTDSQQYPILSPGAMDDPVVAMIINMYGFQVGEPLPKFGTNEFLSALVAVRELKDYLHWDHLIRIAACIEATIPFRGTDSNNKNPMDRLHDRLVPLCPDKNEEWIITTVQKAVTTANWDLGSFNSDDRDYFLDSTWKLMPEGRAALMREDCPIIEYIQEFKSLLVRTNKMPVPIIFQSFRDFPTSLEMDAKRANTYENLDFVSDYGKVRLLQILVLKDFAELMGENPATLPMRPLLRMEMPLLLHNNNNNKPLNPIEQEIRQLLVEGRRTNFTWDPAASHLGALLFDALGMDGITRALDQQETEQCLLKSLPSGLVTTIAARLGSVLPDRVDGIMKVPEKLGILAQ